MKYGIVENHKFILIDDDLQRLKNTLPFMPQYSVEQIGTYDEDQIKQGHDGTWYEKGHAPQRPLEEARTEKLAELEAAFDTASHKAHCTSSVGFEIDANETANRDIEGLTLVMSDTDTTLFCDYNNQFHEVTRAQLETMRREIVANSQRLYQIKWTYRTQIEAATTVDELDAITIRFDKTEGETDEHVQTV